MGEFMLNTFIFTDPDERDPTHCETTVSVVEEPNIFNKEIARFMLFVLCSCELPGQLG
mgnify:CR=1 FL=1